MTGTQPRREPTSRLASSVLRRANVGAGTPGVTAVRRRDGAQALTVPTVPASLHYYGAMNVTAGGLVGDFLSGGDDYVLLEGTPTDDFVNGAAASWSLVDGEYTAQAGGYWALWCAVEFTGADPGDLLTLKLTASTIGTVEMPLLNDGGDVRGAAQIGPCPAFPDITTFTAKVNWSGTGAPEWVGAQATFWPTGLFPEVGP